MTISETRYNEPEFRWREPCRCQLQRPHQTRSIGITQERDLETETREHELRHEIKPVFLLGKEIRPAATEDGKLRSDDNGKPASASAVQIYLY